MIKGRPPRLDHVFPSYDPPLFFVTLCTLHRRKINALETAHDALLKYARAGLENFGVAVGRYVILPDHLHLFVQGGRDFVLGKWIKGLKRAVATALEAQGSKLIWQPGFFDHLLRNDESYARKWEYVRENPVRAGLVAERDQWPHQGEIVVIDRV